MNLSRITEGLKAGSLRFGMREKAWATVLAVVAVMVWGNGAWVLPRARLLREARAGFEEANNRLIELEAQRPNLQERQRKIREHQAQLGSTFQELEKMEEGLLYRQDQDLLLERIVADRKRFKLEINSVEPLREKPAAAKAEAKEKKGAAPDSFYRRLFVQVDAFAPFESLIHYLHSLENQGPYQRVQGVKVKMEKSEKALPRSAILLEVLLADTPTRRQEMREKVFALVEDRTAREVKDPFLAAERPREEKEAAGMELSGIFGDGQRLTALIDGSTVQVGDTVQDKRVVEIRPDRIILEKGEERYFLVEKQAAQ